jgi:hypothetical protein
MRRAASLALGLALVVCACNPSPFDGAAWSRCAEAARDYNGKVAGAFATTVGRVRRTAPDAELFPQVEDGVPATLCYIDADIAKGPPPGPEGQIREPFDRVVLALVDNQVEVVLAGYRADVPVVDP